MRGFLAAASEQLQLALAIHSLLPPRSSAIEARAKAREDRFRHLLHYAYDNSPYYRKQFQGIDLRQVRHHRSSDPDQGGHDGESR